MGMGAGRLSRYARCWGCGGRDGGTDEGTGIGAAEAGGNPPGGLVGGSRTTGLPFSVVTMVDCDRTDAPGE